MGPKQDGYLERPVIRGTGEPQYCSVTIYEDSHLEISSHFSHDKSKLTKTNKLMVNLFKLIPDPDYRTGTACHQGGLPGDLEFV
jgi:hypothetical protein